MHGFHGKIHLSFTSVSFNLHWICKSSAFLVAYASLFSHAANYSSAHFLSLQKSQWHLSVEKGLELLFETLPFSGQDTFWYGHTGQPRIHIPYPWFHLTVKARGPPHPPFALPGFPSPLEALLSPAEATHICPQLLQGSDWLFRTKKVHFNFFRKVRSDNFIRWAREAPEGSCSLESQGMFPRLLASLRAQSYLSFQHWCSCDNNTCAASCNGMQSWRIPQGSICSIT